MDPNLKIVPEEIQKSKEEIIHQFDNHDAKWERWFADLESAHADLLLLVYMT